MIIFNSKFYLYGWLYDLLINPFLKGARKRVAKYVTSSKSYPVIDACCGTGRQCYLLARNGQLVLGFDLDFKIVSYASFKYSDLHFICADAYNIPVRPHSFKSIIFSFSIHDKPAEQHYKMLAQARKLLAPQGKLIFIDFVLPWNFFSRLGYLFVYLVEKLAGKEHFHNGRQFLKSGGLEGFLNRSGFEIINSYNLSLLSSKLVVVE